MTEFHVEVVQIGEVHKHPGADRLEITNVHTAPDGTGGYPVIFQSGTFKPGDLAVYIPVDAVVPDAPEFAWLWEGTPNPPARKRRVKAKRLRGIFSMGLLHPVPATFANEPAKQIVGVDMAEYMGITKYEDPAESEGPAIARTPTAASKRSFLGRVWHGLLVALGVAKADRPSNVPQYGLPAPSLKHLPGYYDIEPFRRYTSWFQPGELVVITEKIHGQNASYVVDGRGKLHLKSRTRWRENDPTDTANAWARVAARYNLESKLATVPGLILYGEAYGNFADMTYGATTSEPGFVAFDAYDSNTGKWLDYFSFKDLCDRLGIPRVPELGMTTWLPGDGVATYAPLAEGKTTIRGARHTREGFVIKPASGRCLPSGQRIIAKMHGEGFLTRKEPTQVKLYPPGAEPLQFITGREIENTPPGTCFVGAQQAAA